MSKTHDNVIVLGAGFSANAGIPLLKDFVQRMIEYHDERQKPEMQSCIREKDKKTLKTALQIRQKLDSYHGRIFFNSWNIEDILSMLALDTEKSKERELQEFVNAITRTIELSCRLQHDSSGIIISDPSVQIYKEFWENLFKWCGQKDKSRKIPTIISFNYDLVLERALMAVIDQRLMGRLIDQRLYGEVSLNYGGSFPFDSVTLDYKYKYFPKQNYSTEIRGALKESKTDNATINILKLHGSLNYPKGKLKTQPSLTDPTENPYVIPPTSNKHHNAASNASWGLAMTRLREAKNVIFVGYSFPSTDVYMQFFLKTALGPNQNLSEVYIFDPVLWDKSNDTKVKEMRNRYETCFSEQFRPRINFNPLGANNMDNSKRGTVDHFVDVLKTAPASILF